MRGERFAIDPAMPDAHHWMWMLHGAAAAAEAAGEQVHRTALDPTDLLNKVFAARGWRELFVRVLEIARAYRPNLVLRDDLDCSGYVTAEVLEIPHVAMSGGPTILLDPQRLADPLAAHGTKFGLSTSGHGLYGYGRVDYVPTEYDFMKHEWPQVFRFRQPVLTRPGERLPSWIADLPADRPLVFAAMGTGVPMYAALQRDGVQLPSTIDPRARFRLVLDALSQLDCVAVVVTGGMDVSDLPRADHVHVTDAVPQPLVLEIADLFLTHDGYNGIREALRSGVPMVAYPEGYDQVHNSARIAELGLGVTVDNSPADAVVEACDKVLADQSFRTRARTARQHVLALPDVHSAPAMLEQFVQTNSYRS
ncbi:glycosyltransferase [Kibdelosporangium philippinense]|uniref:Glycosyltransferase n=1 Tax=Kibdelosporangium philippinense TaxID=211113 RepID=A0ABS8ZGZ7_9PSEU|nr:nucleotide disphospho-sugar-binding domain-containing protein [Kibdelosporangium philippinense]MCE7007103.1 glycosyltransferase [Kibdelosporangium philippinense]